MDESTEFWIRTNREDCTRDVRRQLMRGNKEFALIALGGEIALDKLKADLLRSEECASRSRATRSAVSERKTVQAVGVYRKDEEARQHKKESA